MTKPLVIAEIGWNHMGDMVLAESMVREAANAGASWAKFQTWSVKRLTTGPWDKDGRRQIYEKAELTLEKHLNLINICNKYGISFLSSSFSVDDSKLLLSLGQKAVKIPSFEVSNKELLKHACSNFNEVFISTGTATQVEIIDLKSLVDLELTTILHCVSCYPCPIDSINLPRIAYLKSQFKSVGFSDHTPGIMAAIFSLSYDINIIEKHFTVDHNLPGRDNKFAILPHELADLTSQISNYAKASKDLGVDFQPSESETRKIYRGRFNHG